MDREMGPVDVFVTKAEMVAGCSFSALTPRPLSRLLFRVVAARRSRVLTFETDLSRLVFPLN